MRIVCPDCAAEYEVPASRMTPQRKVRCTRCGGAWLASEAPAPDPVDLEPLEFRADPETEPETQPAEPPSHFSAMDRLAAAAIPSRPPTSLIAAWVMTFVALFTAVGGAVIFREPLVRAWPASSRILGHAQPPPVTPPITPLATQAAPKPAEAAPASGH